jgi:hypothetical protein
MLLLGLVAPACTDGLQVGTFKSPSRVTVSPESALAFAGLVESTGAPVRFTVGNVGGLPSHFVAIELARGDAVDWTVADGSCGGPLVAGDSCTVDVAFTPHSAGTMKSAFLDVVGEDNQVAATLGGVAGQALLTISPPSMAFTPTGNRMNFIVVNMGDLPTQPLDVTVSTGYAVSSDSCSGVTLLPSDKCEMIVMLSPPFPCPSTGSLDVDGGGTARVSAALSCTTT